MASSWIVARSTKPDGRYRGKPRYRVVYRLAGAGSPHHYGGSFPTKAEALERKRWIDGEIAARRVPKVGQLAEPTAAPTLRTVAARWQASRVDLSDNTRLQHRSAIHALLPTFGERNVDTIAPSDVGGTRRSSGNEGM